ncbi:MAG: hypothetical protein NTY02_17455 [Acidobacteria bacterium]|nr:hypothetical protein [Acidobacteriota bacterium]
MRPVVIVTAIGCILMAGLASAQSAPKPPVSPRQDVPAPSDAWSVSAAVFTYIEPDEGAYGVYLQPTLTADRGWLHLEGRFNYEDLDTGSVWLGRNFSVGDALTLEITPRIGAVFGNTDGVAPGFKGTLGWKTLELYSETEYVFDAGDSTQSYLYTWSELAWGPGRGWRVGLVVQRTRVDETATDIQRGFLAGWSSDRVDLTAYVFDPAASRPTVVLGATVRF